MTSLYRTQAAERGDNNLVKVVDCMQGTQMGAYLLALAEKDGVRIERADGLQSSAEYNKVMRAVRIGTLDYIRPRTLQHELAHHRQFMTGDQIHERSLHPMAYMSLCYFREADAILWEKFLDHEVDTGHNLTPDDCRKISKDHFSFYYGEAKRETRENFHGKMFCWALMAMHMPDADTPPDVKQAWNTARAMSSDVDQALKSVQDYVRAVSELPFGLGNYMDQLPLDGFGSRGFVEKLLGRTFLEALKHIEGKATANVIVKNFIALNKGAGSMGGHHPI